MMKLGIALIILVTQTAHAKSKFQTLDIPFTDTKQIVSLKIESKLLGTIGNCKTPNSKKMSACPEPMYPGNCSLKESAPSEVYEIHCVSQEGAEATLLTTVERVRNFKFPDTILSSMESDETLKSLPKEKAQSLIEKKKEKWGDTYFWTTRTEGSRTHVFVCPIASEDCYRFRRDGLTGIVPSVRKIKIKKL